MADDVETFPTLSDTELACVRKHGERREYADGDPVFQAGQAEIDLFVVDAGGLEIRNPAADDIVVAVHGPGQFSGDIDLLTGRPAIVNASAHGQTTLYRIPHKEIRNVLNRAPSFGDKLMTAFTRRREALSAAGRLGIRVVGDAHCGATNLIREFLYKNFVPHHWIDSASEEGRGIAGIWGGKLPAVDCSGTILHNPTLRDLAESAGVWRGCPGTDVDLAIIGAGPAGIAAAVYAASEGLNTILLDRLGPGGQAGGSSKIENFIGFPSGLTGADLATRGVLQMLKFGARMIAPVDVERIEAPDDLSQPRLLHLDCGETIRAKVVLIATGVRWRKLGVDRSASFESAGVHYICTAVESILYDQCDVVVVGGGNSAGQAAMHLAECCRTRQVHLLVRSKLSAQMSEYLVARLNGTANVTIHEGTEIESLDGAMSIDGVNIKRKDKDGTERLKCNAVFVFIGAEPSADWLPKEVARDRLGYVLTGADVTRGGHWNIKDRDPCPLETSLPGVLAAGDVRSGSTKRVGFAVGDGSLAVTCAHTLIAHRPA